MYNPIDSIDGGVKLLGLIAARQKMLSSNLSNMDTPNYSRQDISFSLAALVTLATVFLETLQLSAMFLSLNPKAASLRISRYLVISVTSLYCIYAERRIINSIRE